MIKTTQTSKKCAGQKAIVSNNNKVYMTALVCSLDDKMGLMCLECGPEANLLLLSCLVKLSVCVC